MFDGDSKYSSSMLSSSTSLELGEGQKTHHRAQPTEGHSECAGEPQNLGKPPLQKDWSSVSIPGESDSFPLRQ